MFDWLFLLIKTWKLIWSKEQMESLLNLYDNVFIVRILQFGEDNL